MAEQQSNAPLRAPAGAPTSGVIHVRTRLEGDFTVVANALAQRPGSAVTVGVAVYILSLPDGAAVRIDALCEHFTEGETLISRALRELEAEGYLERRCERGAGGKLRTRTFFHDVPPGDEPVPPWPPRRRRHRTSEGSPPTPGPGRPSEASPTGSPRHRRTSEVPPSGSPRQGRTSEPSPTRSTPEPGPTPPWESAAETGTGTEPAPGAAPPPGPVPTPALAAGYGPTPALTADAGPTPAPPGPVPTPALTADAGPTPAPPSDPEGTPAFPPGPESIPAPATEEPDPRAAAILASLRIVDRRLILSRTDVERLAPAVTQWLAHGVSAEDITGHLTERLPAPLRARPARILAYRLRELPPPLPGRPAAPSAPAVLPWQTCDGGCERAFRAAEPGRCRDCPPGGNGMAAAC